MTYTTVLYSVEGHIARITLNRPERGNMIDTRMASELAEICERIRHDDSIYAVGITGAGYSFCCGAENGLELSCHPALAIAAIEQPVIAVINGDAIAEGLEMALSCDIRIASDDARFCLPQLTQGGFPCGGATQRLPRTVGIGYAMEMFLTGSTVDAGRAFEMGLVNHTFLAEMLPQEAEKIFQAVAGKAPLASRYLKETVIKGMDMTLEQGLRLEADLYFLLHTTADRTEGITAFREKRNPNFKGG
ncbi:MAG: enoyl-CoA hydratase/isomerase family protein [Dehalococcoidales bacterium]|nr:enoyl-CoA hydratase/isomerase family protein [Dehalococcoidales bacterium]